MHILIHNSILGMHHHLLTNPDTQAVQWVKDIPENVWVLGNKHHPFSINCLLETLGEEPIRLFPESHIQAFRQLCPEGINGVIPWRWVLGENEFMDRLNCALERSRINICALKENRYEQTYKTVRKFLLSLHRPRVDAEKVRAYTKSNTKGPTVQAALMSFMPVDGYAPKVQYNQAGTSTGRLTVKKGPRILTLPARYRDIIKPSPGCDMVQIDLVSAEPRTALYVAGKDADGDVYSNISKSLNLDLPRDAVKLAILSALYGAGSNSLSSILGSTSKSKRVIKQLRSHFNVMKIESQLVSDLKTNGYITNLFGRKLMTRKDEYQKVYSHFMQSTTSDAAICMFSDIVESLSKLDQNFKAFYIIHDALVCEVSQSLRSKLEKASKFLQLEGVGNYETKMTSISE